MQEQQQISPYATTAAVAPADADLQARIDAEFARIAGLLTPATPMLTAERAVEDTSRVTAMRALILGRRQKRTARLN